MFCLAQCTNVHTHSPHERTAKGETALIELSVARPCYGAEQILMPCKERALISLEAKPSKSFQHLEEIALWPFKISAAAAALWRRLAMFLPLLE